MKCSHFQPVPRSAASARGSHRVAEKDARAQSLCQICGLCCDGTLFICVLLTPTDELAPKRRADWSVLEDGTHGLKQACRYYRKRLCSIYFDGRPRNCVTFQCALLKRFIGNDVSFVQAQEEIQWTISEVNRLKALWRAGSGVKGRNLMDCFKKWIDSLGRCHARWRGEDEATLRDYAKVLLHLRRTYGTVQQDGEAKRPVSYKL